MVDTMARYQRPPGCGLPLCTYSIGKAIGQFDVLSAETRLVGILDYVSKVQTPGVQSLDCAAAVNAWDQGVLGSGRPTGGRHSACLVGDHAPWLPRRPL